MYITKDKLKSVLMGLPEDQRKEAFDMMSSKNIIEGFNDQGVGGAVGQKKYSPEPEQSTASMVGQSLKAGFTEPAPFVGKAIQDARQGTLPIVGNIAEQAGKHFPNSKAAQYGAAGLGTALGSAAEMVPSTAGELTAQLATGPTALKAAGKALRPIVSELPSLVSKVTRIPEPVVQRAISRTKEIANIPIPTPEDMSGKAKELIVSLKQARAVLGQRLGAIEDRIAEQFPQRSIVVSDVAKNIEDRLAKSGFSDAGDVERKLDGRIRSIVDDFHNLQGGSPEKISPIVTPNGEKIVTPAVKPTQTPLNFRDALNLRRKIDDVLYDAKQGIVQIREAPEAFLTSARNTLNERLKAKSNIFKKANDAFANAASVYDDLAENVIGGKMETVAGKVERLFKRGSSERALLEKADRIGGSGKKVLDQMLDMVTRKQFAPIVNPTLERAAVHTGGGVLGASGLGAAAVLTGMAHPMVGALEAAALAGSSPALNFKMIKAAHMLGEGAGQKAVSGGTAAALAALRNARLLRQQQLQYVQP